MTISLMDSYSNEEFEKIVKECKSYKECAKALGYKAYSGTLSKLLQEKIKKLNIDTSHFTSTTHRKLTEDLVFVENSTVTQKTLRNWYKKGNYSEYKCAICGQEPYWNGKEMTLILDHINGHNTDDRLENLRWVCGNCNTQLETTNGKNKERVEHTLNYCVDCGAPISKNSTRCMACENKRRIVPVEKMAITREELKELIRSQSFLSIGRKFGVSDNAIRKWCQKFNLPYKKTEINKYSEEEWQEI